MRTGPSYAAIAAHGLTASQSRMYSRLAGGMFNTVLSDMAPNTTGHGDDFLSVRLCRRVLELLPAVLAQGGCVLMKVLEGEEFPKLLRQTKALFKEAGATKPAASRDLSREIFIFGTGYLGPRLNAGPPRSGNAKAKDL